jgi:hypothetical protein
MVLVIKELHRPGSWRSMPVPVVLHPEKLDHSLRIFRAGHPAGDPTGVWQHMVGFRPTRGDHLVVKLAGQGQVGQAVAGPRGPSPAHLFIRTTEAVRDGFYSWPGQDRLSDAIAGAFHSDSILLPWALIQG